MRRIQHPRATAAFPRDPPSKAAVEITSGEYRTATVDDEGYVLVRDDFAEPVMDGLADQYGVGYDRDTGEIVSHAGNDLEADHQIDAGFDDDDNQVDVDSAGKDAAEGDDLEAWENWNRDDWLALGWEDRKADVENGLVDDHLEEIIDVESNQSKRVCEAAQERLEELEG
ncbi:hypothetical protein RBH26_20600 [Natronolimnohabitans sp. A-GB9]|uniref:hypothetical protein n=1 Tax=Natronolimnohabitans sp. A-GB9 TaxID=3069757 RepID=UPI0027B67175|nr:hypothetical protein [Natronolimnohabitans sp. A-GB9]MDQ2052845.1 hypothetical protein [Natronolimnohabitans sp. A-GB9]